VAQNWRRVLYPHSPFGLVARVSATHKRDQTVAGPPQSPTRSFEGSGSQTDPQPPWYNGRAGIIPFERNQMARFLSVCTVRAENIQICVLVIALLGATAQPHFYPPLWAGLWTTVSLSLALSLSPSLSFSLSFSLCSRSFRRHRREIGHLCLAASFSNSRTHELLVIRPHIAQMPKNWAHQRLFCESLSESLLNTYQVSFDTY
jgi:hypothetical protein